MTQNKSVGSRNCQRRGSVTIKGEQDRVFWGDGTVLIPDCDGIT